MLSDLVWLAMFGRNPRNPIDQQFPHQMAMAVAMFAEAEAQLMSIARWNVLVALKFVSGTFSRQYLAPREMLVLVVVYMYLDVSYLT